MPLLVIIIAIAVILAIVIISILEVSLKKARKRVQEQMVEIDTLESHRAYELKQLAGYTKQDPITAYSLLIEHVKNAEKSRRGR